MKILALSPFDVKIVTGNVTTLLRIQSGMEARGHEFSIVPVGKNTTESDLRNVLNKIQPDVVHYYHAFKTGRFLPTFRDFPSVLTLSGTDMNRDLNDPDRRTVLESTLAEADRILTYNPSIAERATEHSSKVNVISKGVTLGNDSFDLRGRAACTPEDMVFLQAGGIRPVKNNLMAFEAVGPSTKVLFIGPIMNGPYGQEFMARLEACPRAHHLPDVPFNAMASVWMSVDVAINTSHSEGLSNSLMEAMATETAVLAADIPGNRDLIENGITGLLYSGVDDLREKARRLTNDPELRSRLARAGRLKASREFSTEAEIDAHVTIYRQAIGGIA